MSLFPNVRHNRRSCLEMQLSVYATADAIHTPKLSLILPALLNSLPHALGVFPPVVFVEVRRLDVCGRAGIRVVE